MMNMKLTTNSTEIKSYEEYLTVFFPELGRTEDGDVVTPKEIGIKMAEETLSHIQNLLTKNKSA
jgi:hypothetical protein